MPGRTFVENQPAGGSDVLRPRCHQLRGVADLRSARPTAPCRSNSNRRKVGSHRGSPKSGIPLLKWDPNPTFRFYRQGAYPVLTEVLCLLGGSDARSHLLRASPRACRATHPSSPPQAPPSTPSPLAHPLILRTRQINTTGDPSNLNGYP